MANETIVTNEDQRLNRIALKYQLFQLRIGDEILQLNTYFVAVKTFLQAKSLQTSAATETFWLNRF